ncbi:hypothetical protein HGM15179_008471 [Zosterops borbonicus]|uniref:Uncharacterized protein n=1 Tax=Zosterops borbonicus TaxID=364589 RepID=A0A8K1LLI4_9PASS|nr:hypothetical protein HGM15179_008471 [Zosterops borbonicus]
MCVVLYTTLQDLELGLFKPHTTGLSPSIQLVQIPLKSPPTLQQIDIPTQFVVIHKFTKGRINPLIKIINKEIE